MSNWTMAPTLVGALGIMFLSAEGSSPATEQETWRQHWLSGRQAFEQGRFGEAEETLNRALEAARSLKTDQSDIARILNHLGQAKWDNRDPVGAISALEESVRLWEKSKTPEHPDFAASLGSLGLLYALSGYTTLACDPLREAVKIAEQAAAHGQAALVQSQNILGILAEQGVCGVRKRVQRAKEHLQRAMTTSQTALSADDPLRALTLENYARLLEKTGRAREAIPHRREATRIRNLIIQKFQGVKAGVPRPPEKVGPAPQHVGGAVTQPALLRKQEPEYSALARLAKLQGTVVLSLIVDGEGDIRNVRLARGLGLGLDEQAYWAVHAWKFKPATKEGQPVPVYATVEVNFRLF